MKRLIARKTLADLQNIEQNVFTTLGQDGRNILKAINDYKYKVSQFSEIVADEKGKKKIKECIKDLDNVSAFIYSFVYDLENYELVEDYDKRIEFTVPEDMDKDIDLQPEEEEIVEETNEEEVDEENPFGDENPFDQAEENDEEFEMEEEEI